MLTIGSTVNGYRIEMMLGRTVFAVNSHVECPEPYAVWDLDYDGCGVNNGRYYGDRFRALAQFYTIVADKEGS